METYAERSRLVTQTTFEAAPSRKEDQAESLKKTWLPRVKRPLIFRNELQQVKILAMDRRVWKMSTKSAQFRVVLTEATITFVS